MRLGGYFFKPSTISQLEEYTKKCDYYGLSAIPAPHPPDLMAMSDEQAAQYGEHTRKLGLVIGESGYWANHFTGDTTARAQHVKTVRAQLQKADAMGVRCMATFPGTRSDAHVMAPHPDNWSQEFKAELREHILRILDGLDLKTTKWTLEPWHNTFFYKPADIAEFLDYVDHPLLSFHCDPMNMISQDTFFHSTDLINELFELLAGKVVSVHLKDIQCEAGHAFLKWNEVHIGEGVMDYDTLVQKLAQLPQETTCYCEHLPTEADYVLNFARLHSIAERNGTKFLKRGES